MLNIYTLYVVIAALLDIVANLALNKSYGFKNLKWGFFSLLLVCLAFTFFLFVLESKQIPLAVAYSLWGSIGILGTTLGSWYFFGDRLKLVGWIGIFVIIIAVITLTTA